MFALLLDYKWQISLLVVFSLLANGLSLLIPKIIASSIDQYTSGQIISQTLLIEFIIIILGVFIFTYAQGLIQNYVSELVAKDFRKNLIKKISYQSYAYVQKSHFGGFVN